MLKNKNVISAILSHLLSIVILIVILYIANAYVVTDNPDVLEIISFLNNNLLFIILMTIIFMIADIFYAFPLPINLPAPIFGSMGAMFVVTFIFRVLALIDVLLSENIVSAVIWIKWLLYPLVVIIVLVSGYISIFFRAFESPARPTEPREKIIDIKPSKDNENKSKPRHKSWEDVGNEFRNMLYEIFNSLKKKSKGK